MRFICDKSVIVKEISIAQEIISSRNALSILSNVLLEAENDALVIKATDLKVGFETRIPAVVEISGSTTVFCDKFLGILRSLPEGEITFDFYHSGKKESVSEKFAIKPYQVLDFKQHFKATEKEVDHDAWFEVSVVAEVDGEPVLVRKRLPYIPKKFNR